MRSEKHWQTKEDCVSSIKTKRNTLDHLIYDRTGKYRKEGVDLSRLKQVCESDTIRDFS